MRAWTLVVVCLAASPATAQSLAFPNPVENGSFTASLRAWSVLSTDGAATWDAFDYQGAGSGAVKLSSSAGPLSGNVQAQQCVASAAGDATFEVSARLYAPAGQPLGPRGAIAFLWLGFYETRDCSGPGTAAPPALVQLGPDGTLGAWQSLLAHGTSPARTRSVRVVLQYFRDGGQPTGTSSAYFDAVRLLGRFRAVRGDLNGGGGEADLILRHSSSGELRAWFMNDEQRLLDPALFSPPVPASLQVAGVADFDGDERNDLMLWNPGDSTTSVWLLNGITRVGAARPLSGALGWPWRPEATADFDHDGRPDVVYRSESTGRIVVRVVVGLSEVATILPSPSTGVSAGWRLVGTPDLNGDGNADFLWHNRTTGRAAYWLMDAAVRQIAGAFTNPAEAGDVSWELVAAGDYGIGPGGLPATTDLVWQNRNSGQIVVWFMDGAGNRTHGGFVSPAPSGPEWRVAAPR